ncbi:MAG TPA: tetratricopeptide repeat protein [Methanoregula sp.]|nr:tetratricopeptide repeat protein [Methanoregula sp.]
MIPLSREDRKREAFRLFEDGRYQEALRQCELLLEEGKDPAVDILAATSLFNTGRLEDAELFFRDLVQRMPGSSYVHSYLAKVLAARENEAAIGEYATAVLLDPDNQDALRSYAGYLAGRGDYAGALPVLKRLAALSRRLDDVRQLMHAFNELGRPEESLAAHAAFAGDRPEGPEYVSALFRAGNYPGAATAARALYEKTKDPAALRNYLRALARYDPGAAREAYSSCLQDTPDCEILLDYSNLLRERGDIAGALTIIRQILARSRRPGYRLAECDLLAAAGETTRALALYEQLIRDELSSKEDMDLLGTIIGRYRRALTKGVTADDGLRRFLAIVSSDLNAVSLVETARLYEERGEPAEARAWYYRAYRADFLTGGIAYAVFLSLHDEERECEKVMLYILANAKKSADLARVAAVATDRRGKMTRLRRLNERLIYRLGERRSALGSEGLALLARAYLIGAAASLEEGDYARCKHFCLSGIDVLPGLPQDVTPEDFLVLIRTCKERAVADRPIMNVVSGRMPAIPPESPAVHPVTARLGLSEMEQKLVDFLRIHRTATEMELRRLLGTRRVVGIVNRIVQKASADGISLIGKKGVGEDGEVYEYTGT